jgi:flagellar biosynthesis protein FlhF
MKLKSFFANTVEEAIRLARQELGPDAMLVNSKRSEVEARHLGCYEIVVCAETQPSGSSDEHGRERRRDLAPERGKESRGESKQGGARAVAATLPVDKLSQDVSELKQRLEKLALTLARSGRGLASVAFDPDLSRAFTLLTDAEIDTELAYDLVSKLKFPVSDASLRAELAKLVSIDSELGVPGAPARVVALAGPPGAGKTSALVRLAIQHGIAVGKSVQILTTDTFRIAAAEELRSYAAILGIGCQVLETPAALARALDEYSPGESGRSGKKDLVLIDTPGLCRVEMEASEELAQVLAAHPGVDTHLVLPASMRASDLRRVSEQYSVFEPRKLLFTRMDETETFGPILSRSVRMDKAVSFLSRGQRIPEDLEPATLEGLLDLVLGRLAVPAPKFGMAAA